MKGGYAIGISCIAIVQILDPHIGICIAIVFNFISVPFLVLLFYFFFYCAARI
jgi:hypothetical protein